MSRSRAGAVLALVAVAAGWWAWPSERVLHSRRSSFQHLVVAEDAERRCLRFGDGDRALNQSCRSLAHPEKVELDYARAIVASSLTLQPAPRRVLLIGLGGASIPNALVAARPELELDAVELDPAVIHLAEQYFGFTQTERVHAFAADGARFVEALGDRRYDLIILDACDETGMPPPLFAPEFLSRVKSALSEEGAFIANTFPGTATAPREADAVRRAFGEVTEVHVVRNRLLVAGRLAIPSQVSPELERVGVTAAWLAQWTVRTTR